MAASSASVAALAEAECRKRRETDVPIVTPVDSTKGARPSHARRASPEKVRRPAKVTRGRVLQSRGPRQSKLITVIVAVTGALHPGICFGNRGMAQFRA